MNTIASIPATLLEWAMSIAPTAGVLLFIGWCLWRYHSWLSSRFDRIDTNFLQIKDRFTEVDRKVERIELETKARFDKVDIQLDNLDKRLTKVENTIEQVLRK